MKLRHEKAAEFWRINGRDNTLTGQEFGVTPLTVARWRDTEDWIRIADQKDAADAAALAAASLDAAQRHTQETDKLLGRMRHLLDLKLNELHDKMRDGVSIDEPELRTAAILLDSCVKAGATKYGAAAIKIEKTVTSVTDAQQEAERLRAQLEAWQPQPTAQA